MIADPRQTRQTKAPRLSIIVPAVRANDELRACLASLVGLDPPCDDVVVVSDGGPDGVARLAEDAGATVVRLQKNSGPAVARNEGAKVARGDVLFFVDADVVVPPGIVGQVQSAFEQEPELCGVIGSYDDSPGAPNFLSQYKNLAHHFVHQTSRRQASSFWSACGAVRRDAFERVGGFDRRIRRSSIEDIELGARLLDAGCAIRLDRSIQVKHLKRWTAWSLLMSEIRDRAIPWTRLILRQKSMPDDLNLRWRGRVAVAMAGGLPATLAAAIWKPRVLLLTCALVVGLLVLDRQFLLFLGRQRGWWFAARAAGAHWVHYLCSGVGFAIGVCLHLIGPTTWPPAGTDQHGAAPS